MRSDLALAALASAAVPGMKPVAVAEIIPARPGSGPELQQALVEDATGQRWLVRAPLGTVAGARLQRDDELVRGISRHVPFKVPAAAGYAPLGKHGKAAVYPYVEGVTPDLRRLPAGHGLASALGRAVAAIHSIPREVLEEQDVPVFDATDVRRRAIAEVDRAAETGQVPAGLLARWEEAFDAAPLWQFATTVVHGSFTGDNVLVAFSDEDDASTGRVVAVTDWDQAMIGDPATDLAAFWAQTSRQAWETVIDSYAMARSHPPDPYLQARARLTSEIGTLRGLARAVSEGDEDTVRHVVEALRRMDRLTDPDNSLVPATARTMGSTPPPTSRPPDRDDAARADDTPSAGRAHEVGRALAGYTAADDTEQLDAVTEEPDSVLATGKTGEPPAATPPTRSSPAVDNDPTMEVPPPRTSTSGIDRPQAGPAAPAPESPPRAHPDLDEAVPSDSEQGAEEDEPAASPNRPAGGRYSETARGTNEETTDGGEEETADGGEEETADGGEEETADGGAGETADEGDEESSDAASPTVADEDPPQVDTERLHELYGMPNPDRDAEP